MERSAIKNLSSINTFKSLKNVEKCSEEAHKGQLSVQLSVRKTTFFYLGYVEVYCLRVVMRGL